MLIPCDGTQSAEDYAGLVSWLRDAVTADPAPLLDRLRGRMVNLATDGRYERAGDARRRLHTVASVLSASRRTARLADVDELIATRDQADGREVVLVRHGRRASSRPGATLGHRGRPPPGAPRGGRGAGP